MIDWKWRIFLVELNVKLGNVTALKRARSQYQSEQYRGRRSAIESVAREELLMMLQGCLEGIIPGGVARWDHPLRHLHKINWTRYVSFSYPPPSLMLNWIGLRAQPTAFDTSPFLNIDVITIAYVPQQQLSLQHY